MLDIVNSIYRKVMRIVLIIGLLAASYAGSEILHI